MNLPALSIDSLGISYSIGNLINPVVRNFSLEIWPGQVIGLIGPSGSGKSSIGKAVLGVLPENASCSGVIKIFGKEVRIENPGQKLPVSYIPQEPWRSISENLTIGQQLELYLTLSQSTKVSKTAMNAEAVRILRGVKIKNPEKTLKSYAFNLSGGELQRIAIAFAIAKKSKIVIADEATSSLDPNVKKEILAIIKEVAQENGVSFLFISHDYSSLNKICDDVVSLKPSTKNDPEFRLNIDAVKQQLATHREPQRPNHNVLVVKRLSVHFNRQKNPVVSGVSFSIENGEILALVGESGSGKTTIARAITGLAKYSGEIKFHFDSEQELLNNNVRSKLGYVFQDSSASLNPRMTISQILSEPLMIHEPRVNAVDREKQIAKWLDILELPNQTLKRQGHELSGGERQRVNLARALINEPKLLIADEPTSSLHPELEEEVLLTLIGIQKTIGFSMLFVSHNLDLVLRHSNKLAVLEAGRIAEYGPTGAIFKSPKSKFMIDSV